MVTTEWLSLLPYPVRIMFRFKGWQNFFSSTSHNSVRNDWFRERVCRKRPGGPGEIKLIMKQQYAFAKIPAARWALSSDSSQQIYTRNYSPLFGTYETTHICCTRSSLGFPSTRKTLTYWSESSCSHQDDWNVWEEMSLREMSLSSLEKKKLKRIFTANSWFLARGCRGDRDRFLLWVHSRKTGSDRHKVWQGIATQCRKCFSCEDAGCTEKWHIQKKTRQGPEQPVLIREASSRMLETSRCPKGPTKPTRFCRNNPAQIIPHRRKVSQKTLKEKFRVCGNICAAQTV